MRKILELLFFLSVAFSCSEDNLTNEEHSPKVPTDITFSSQSASVGDTLTVNGNGFLIDETYVITFSQNALGTITEKTSSFLKVIIPANAVSGNVSMTFNDETTKIGTIEIIHETSSAIYIFHDSEKKLAKIDLTNGDLTYIGNNIDYGSNTRGAVYHSTNNEYIGFENDFTNPGLVRINLSNGIVTTITISSSFLTNGADFSDLMIDKNDNIYIFHDSEKKLAKIDLTNGDLSYIGNNIDYGSNTRGAVYHSTNNEYIGFENDFTNPGLVRINLSNGTVTTIAISSSFLTNGADFSDLMIVGI